MDAETIKRRRRIAAALREIWTNGTVDDSPRIRRNGRATLGLGAASAKGSSDALKVRELRFPVLFTGALVLIRKDRSELLHAAAIIATEPPGAIKILLLLVDSIMNRMAPGQ
jgi:hypothetical protein